MKVLSTVGLKVPKVVKPLKGKTPDTMVQTMRSSTARLTKETSSGVAKPERVKMSVWYSFVDELKKIAQEKPPTTEAELTKPITTKKPVTMVKSLARTGAGGPNVMYIDMYGNPVKGPGIKEMGLGKAL
jgi:hypothetical protein